jgi:hypothetical protein
LPVKGQTVGHGQLTDQLHALGLGLLDVLVVAETEDAARPAQRVSRGRGAREEADFVVCFALEHRRRDLGLAVQEALLDTSVPAIELFGIEVEIAVLAVELIETRSPEALAEAGAQDGRALVQRPGGRDLAQGVLAVGVVVFVAQAAGQGQAWNDSAWSWP